MINDLSTKSLEKIPAQPLGMPAGSVRAIMALTTLGTLAYGFLTGLVTVNFFEKVVLLMVGSYFASKIKK